jgi:hypothetical protein
MSDVSQLPDIIDASAAVARRITGVLAAFGVGNGQVIDAYTSLPIPAAPSDALDLGPGTHVSYWPSAVAIKWLSATVCEITWTIPMKLALMGPDLATLLSQGAPMIAAYLATFAQYSQLCRPSDGLPRCNSALITGAQPRQDPPAVEFVLTAVERLNFDLQPGGVI